MRRVIAVASAALALVAAGCDASGDDDGGSSSASTTREVTTTRVEVVEGIGREGGFEGIEEYLDTTYVALPAG